MNPFLELDLRPWERDCCHGVVSLLDMLKFAAQSFWRASETLADIKNDPASGSSPFESNQWVENLKGLAENLQAMNLSVSLREFVKFNQWMSAHVQHVMNEQDGEKQKQIFRARQAEVKTRIAQLSSVIESELQSRLFFFMQSDRVEMWNPAWLTDTSIYTNFPEAHEEFQRAGRCFGYGEGTACVFHLMRVIDSGLRLVYASLGETYDARNWEGIAKKIESEMSKKHTDKTEDWRKKEPFYSSVLTDIRSIARAHRNPALHEIQRKYTDDEARYLIEVTKAFMTHLAQNGMKEPQDALS